MPSCFILLPSHFLPQCLHLWNRDKNSCSSWGCVLLCSSSKRSRIMAHAKINEVIWLSAPCRVEEGWRVNTKQRLSHVCFHCKRAGPFSSPSAGSYKRGNWGGGRWKYFFTTISCGEPWSGIGNSEGLWAWHYRLHMQCSLKRAMLTCELVTSLHLLE